MKQQVKCPTCGKYVEWSEKHPWRPFCSDRCRMIDLGSWADENYRIKGKADAKEVKELLKKFIV